MQGGRASLSCLSDPVRGHQGAEGLPVPSGQPSGQGMKDGWTEEAPRTRGLCTARPHRPLPAGARCPAAARGARIQSEASPKAKWKWLLDYPPFGWIICTIASVHYRGQPGGVWTVLGVPNDLVCGGREGV